MKVFILGLLILIALVSCKNVKTDKDVASHNVREYTIEQFMDNENVSGGGFSADNSKIVVSSNRSGIYNAYTISTKDGEITAVTQSDSISVFATSYFPNDDRMLLKADANGDEVDHIFVRELDGTIKNKHRKKRHEA